jgi:hypothetical protein
VVTLRRIAQYWCLFLVNDFVKISIIFSLVLEYYNITIRLVIILVCNDIVFQYALCDHEKKLYNFDCHN